MPTDYVIVGSGLTGAVIARLLCDAGRSVVVVDRRTHLGGNVHDHVHQSGIRVHTYGPHYFRTNSDEIWEFVTRFAAFHRYEACIKSYVDGRHENWPIAASYIRRAIGDGWQPVFRGIPSNFEEASLAMMPRQIYEKFVRGYSEKQWGVPAHALSAELAKRFDVREDDEPRLCRHRYQGIPADGYAALMSNMLQGIPVVLDCDYMRHRGAFPFRQKLVFTGPIDEFFDFDLGRLRYRGQRREHSYHADVNFAQPCGQVNFPDPAHGPHIRQMEWTHMMPPESLPGNHRRSPPPERLRIPFPRSGERQVVCTIPAARRRDARSASVRPPGRVQVLRHGSGDRPCDGAGAADSGGR
jgi:UDP-galactopyranose mutase